MKMWSSDERYKHWRSMTFHEDCNIWGVQRASLIGVCNIYKIKIYVCIKIILYNAIFYSSIHVHVCNYIPNQNIKLLVEEYKRIKKNVNDFRITYISAYHYFVWVIGAVDCFPR